MSTPSKVHSRNMFLRRGSEVGVGVQSRHRGCGNMRKISQSHNIKTRVLEKQLLQSLVQFEMAEAGNMW